MADVNLAGGVAVLVRQPDVRLSIAPPRQVVITQPPDIRATVRHPSSASFVVSRPSTSVAVLPVRGPAGPAGSGAGGGEGGSSYRHAQTIPSTVWLIPHNLGYQPGGIEVVDHAGVSHRPAMSWPDVDTVRLDFDRDVYGTAYLS